MPAIRERDHLGFDVVAGQAGDHPALPVPSLLLRRARQDVLRQAQHDFAVADVGRQVGPGPDHRQEDPVRGDEPMLAVEQREAVADGFQCLPQAQFRRLGGGIGTLELAEGVTRLAAQRLRLVTRGFETVSLRDDLIGKRTGMQRKLCVRGEEFPLLLVEQLLRRKPPAAFLHQPFDKSHTRLRSTGASPRGQPRQDGRCPVKEV